MNNPPPVQDLQPEPVDRHEARRQRRADSAQAGTWIMGIILIVLGIGFLLQNMGSYVIPLKNWWALFILLPAVGALERAWHLYTESGQQLTTAATGSLMIGTMFLLITFAFLFDISWTYFGPVLLVLVGLGIVLTNLFGRK